MTTRRRITVLPTIARSAVPRTGLRAAAAATLLLAAGCASLVEPHEHDVSARRLFSVGYENLSERYIEPVELDTVAVAGLNQLSEIDPAVAISRSGRRVVLTAAATAAGAWQAPDPVDVSGWAALTATVLETASEASPALRGRGDRELFDAVFDGVMSKFDRYSRYANPETARSHRAMRDGFGGLGITIRRDGDATFIDKVHPDTPAQRAGLRPKDRITHVDGVAITGKKPGKVIEMLRGSIDSPVILRLARPGEPEPVEVEVVRALIVLPTVAVKRDRGILSISITGFNQATAQEVTRHLERAESEMGAGLKGIIIDLRNNPGGLLQQAVSVADLFLTDGLVISTKGRHPKSHQVFDARSGQLAANVPVVVLVNGKSASAAEIVAAALLDRGRAVLLGSSSYGKGTVQTIVRLPNGGELTLTWARMHSPSGAAIQDNGIVPTICTSADAARVKELMSALRAGRKALARSLLVRLRPPEDGGVGADKARAACPPDAGTPASDSEIARHVLLDRGLYTNMLRKGRTAIAKRPSG